MRLQCHHDLAEVLAPGNTFEVRAKIFGAGVTRVRLIADGSDVEMVVAAPDVWSGALYRVANGLQSRG
ncbi:hypothetical protein [Tardiphaga sp.]|uniref:hypothetical protein n=1 Tax=Tardiphaga sp. TaxID=1926292 RepID=UPI00261BBE2C|nr:hypothetical protein [Tardiphaga sp.]MDB5619888.1 hypothetical protein [Tardiphaga sp.]